MPGGRNYTTGVVVLNVPEDIMTIRRPLFL